MKKISRQRKSKNTSKSNLEDVEDEIDTFSKEKDLIPLNPEEDSEENSEEEDDYLNSVHDLELDEEDGEEEEDGEDEYLGFQENESEEEKLDEENEEDDGKLLTSEWGKSKKTYYKTDYDDDLDSDPEAAKEEEAEAKRLQKKKAELLAQEDFEEPETLEQLQKTKKVPSKKEEKGSDSSLLTSFNKDLDSIDIEEGSFEIENVSRDASSLSEKEKLDIVMNESPELLALIEDFKTKISEIRNNIQPLYEKVKNGEFPTSKGVSFLEVKYHLLLSYCTNIVFYLLLKAEGKQVKDHPVIDQLVKLRTIIEKLKPIDQKLKYQIDKLLKILSTGNLDHLKNDPRSFKPNIEDLKENAEEDQETKKNGVYVPPKISETFYEDKITKEERKKERAKKRAIQGSMMEFINQTYGDKPEEIAELGARDKFRDREALERERYEEDNFIRLHLTKKEKHKEHTKLTKDDTLEKLTQFDDISSLLEESEKKGKSQLKVLANNLGQGKRKFVQGDEDYEINDQKKSGKKRNADLAELNNEEEDEEIESEDEFYKQVEQEEKNKKKKKQEAKKQKKQHKPMVEEYVEENKKRAISKNIESTRGLTRARPKDIKTPHKKSRKRYDKALKKRSGVVKKIDRSKPYSGESTGIKTHVKHSINLR